MRCIPPNPRWVGIYRPIHGPLDGPLYMGSIYSNNIIEFSELELMQGTNNFHHSEQDWARRFWTSLLCQAPWQKCSS